MFTIKNHTVIELDDVLGIYQGPVYQFRLDIDVPREDSAFCAFGTGLELVYETGNTEDLIHSHSFYNKQSQSVLSVLLTDEERKVVVDYCASHLPTEHYLAFNEATEKFSIEKKKKAREGVLICKEYFEIDEQDFTGILVTIFEEGLLVKQLTNMNMQDHIENCTEAWANQSEHYLVPSLGLAEAMFDFAGGYDEVKEELIIEWKAKKWLED